jgi:hypothetical protein
MRVHLLQVYLAAIRNGAQQQLHAGHIGAH